jgi:hypothetical protein
MNRDSLAFKSSILWIDDMGKCQSLFVKVLVLHCAVFFYLKRRVEMQACLLRASRLTPPFNFSNTAQVKVLQGNLHCSFGVNLPSPVSSSFAVLLCLLSREVHCELNHLSWFHFCVYSYLRMRFHIRIYE